MRSLYHSSYEQRPLRAVPRLCPCYATCGGDFPWEFLPPCERSPRAVPRSCSIGGRGSSSDRVR